MAHYEQIYREQEKALRELHYKFLKALGTSLPVGLPKVSTAEAYEQIFEIMQKERSQLLESARLMHFDLISSGFIPYQECVDRFGMKAG